MTVLDFRTAWARTLVLPWDCGLAWDGLSFWASLGWAVRFSAGLDFWA